MIFAVVPSFICRTSVASNAFKQLQEKLGKNAGKSGRSWAEAVGKS